MNIKNRIICDTVLTKSNVDMIKCVCCFSVDESSTEHPYDSTTQPVPCPSNDPLKNTCRGNTFVLFHVHLHVDANVHILL